MHAFDNNLRFGDRVPFMDDVAQYRPRTADPVSTVVMLPERGEPFSG